MFSKELEQSIANLFDQAQDQNLEYLTIEHLLLMLLSDFEVRQALETNEVNIATLRENLEEHVRDNTPNKVDAKKPVQPTLGFQRVLQRAVFHVQSSGKGVVKPINLLVAIFSEKESHSVFLLSKQGIGRLDIVSYISHGKPEASQTDADKIKEPGFTLSWPAYLGAVPCVASNSAESSLIFAPGAIPIPPTHAAKASDT